MSKGTAVACGVGLLTVLLALAWPSARAVVAQPAEVRVTLFHDTHIHGNIQGREGVTFAHYVGLMKKLRAELPAPGQSLFVGNGDDIAAAAIAAPEREVFTAPTLLTAVSDGQHTVDALNAAGIDATTLGYNEFDVGTDRLRQLLAGARYPYVTANLRDPRTGGAFGGEFGVRRWVIKEVGGVKVGLTGLAPVEPYLTGRAAPDVRIMDPVEALREVLPELRGAGADIVVLLSHLLPEDTERVVAAVDGVDVSVGTHSMQVLDQPRSVGRTIISQRGSDLALLGQLDLFVSGGRIVRYVYQAHSVTPEAPADPAIRAVVQEYLARAQAELAAPAGTISGPLDTSRSVVWTGESAAGNLVADALRAWAGADVALHHGGYLGGQRTFGPGELTRRDVVELVPFVHAMVLRVSGAQLLAALENGVSRAPEEAARFAHVSGMRFTYDPSLPAGGRIVSATVGQRSLDSAASYTLATTDFVGLGLGGYDALQSAETVVPHTAGPTLVSIVLDYLASRGGVDPAVEGRIRVAGAPAPAPAQLPRALPHGGVDR
jgi:2',3'-cyclic-nucleotide 2'-phosphodiesterase/3'-nucleotidase